MKQLFILSFLILGIPITRFPGISEHLEEIKLAVYLLFFLVWLSYKQLDQIKQLSKLPLTSFFIFFLLLAFFSLVPSTDKFWTLRFTLQHAVSFGYFYVFCDIFKNKKYLEIGLYLFVLSGFLCGSLAILQYLIVTYNKFSQLGRFALPYISRHTLVFESPTVFQMMGYRSVGPFYHPNLLGLYLSLILPIALTLFFIAKNKYQKFFLMGCAVVVVMGIICSRSRGSFVSLVASVVFISVFLWRKIPKVIFLACVVLLVMAGFFLWDKIIYYLRLENVLSFRDFIWEHSVRMVQENPVFGLGLGMFHEEYLYRYSFPSVGDFQEALGGIMILGASELTKGFHAHNLFLNYAAELGLGGAVLMLVLYGIYFKEFIFFIRRRAAASLYDTVLIVGSSAVIFGNFIYSFFEAATNFYNFSIALSFVFVCAVGISLMVKYKSVDI